MQTKKPAALFDFDLTLTTKDSFMQFAGFLLKSCPGAWRNLPGLVVRTVPYSVGLVSKERMKSLVVGMMAGLSEQAAADLVVEFCNNIVAPTYLPKGLERLAWHKREGHTLVLASASVDVYLEPISRELGFDVLVCSRTSRTRPLELVGKNCLGIEKVKRLQKLPFFDQTDWKESYAYSDHISDLPMFMLCGKPVAANPSRALRAYAKKVGWEIVNWR